MSRLASEIAEAYHVNPIAGSELDATAFQFIVRDPGGPVGAIATTEIISWLESSSFARLDENGHIVGPIILSSYANAAAAGVLEDGELGVVADRLHLGDGSTTGGVRVGGAQPSYHSVSATGSITVDPYASHTIIFATTADAAFTITISNITDIPIGHLIYLYVEKGGTTDAISISGSNGDVVLSGQPLGTVTSLILAKKSVDASFGWVVLQIVST